MHRRSFVGGLAALAPSGLMAQESTPEGSQATETLRYLIDDVVAGGDYSGLADVAGAIDPNDLIEDMASLHPYAENGVSVQMMAADGNQAITYAIITDSSGTDYGLFFYITVDADGALLSYQWRGTGSL